MRNRYEVGVVVNEDSSRGSRHETMVEASECQNREPTSACTNEHALHTTLNYGH